jgi:rubrerythrin
MEETRVQEPTPPGALGELARDPSSRKRFLKMAGGSAVAAGLSAALAACGNDKSKSTPKGSALGPLAQYGAGDAGVLNYALTLEHLETAFYEAAIKTGTLTGRNLTRFKQFGAEEAEHVIALTAAVKKLGGTPVQPQQTSFPLATEQMILSTASTLESLGAGAYLGQFERIESREVLAMALSIHSVEARHAATLNQALGHSPTPNGAFASPVTAEELQGQIQTFLAG